MKKTNLFIALLLATLLFSSTQLLARSSNIVYSQNYQMDQDLDLNAVASIFGESRDLHDFERRLNDPYYQISNLDLNRDGYVDYLRVIEFVDGPYHLIVIQAVIGYKRYQDIATIEVSKRYNQVYVEIVGDRYIYGPNYIIEPLYYYRPDIFRTFWQRRYYTPYYSSYRWRYYPSYYRPWRPLPVPYYHRHIRKHISHQNRYRVTKQRRAGYKKKMHNRIKRDDYARKYPNRSYKKRMQQKKSQRKNIKKSVKKREKNRIRERKTIQKSKIYSPRSTQPKRRTHSSVKRSNTKEAVRHRDRSKKELKHRRAKPTNRYKNRQKVQERSITRQRRE